MKRILTNLFILLLLSAYVDAQIQLENAGFEQWEDVLVSETDTIREPAEWSSLKTSDDPALSTVAPLVCWRSNEAHSGDYSVKLINVEVFSVVANGMVTNGLVHPNFTPELAYIYSDTVNDQWNTPFTGRPDSIAGWFMYSPQVNDTLQVIVALHRGFGKQPDTNKTETWVGEAEYKSPLDTQGEWVRFSAPFNYNNDSIPEYVLVVLNSGSGYSPVAGSIAQFDDLEMIYNSQQTSVESLQKGEGSIYPVGYSSLRIDDLDLTHYQKLSIHDLTGKLAWESELTSFQVEISSANLKRGIYIVSLSGKNKVFSQKIMLH